MADDIKKINDEINKLRAELGKNPLKPFDNDDGEKAQEILVAFAQPKFNIGGRVMSFSRQAEKDLEEIENTKYEQHE